MTTGSEPARDPDPDPGSDRAHGTSGTLRVRPAVRDDATELYELSVRAIRESAAAHYTAAQLEAWAATRSVEGHRRLIEASRTVVVVDDVGRAAGFLTLLSEPGDPDAEVDQLFVDPCAGGRGVARLLLGAAEHAARQAGHGGVVTHASWRAVPVFERHGYRQVRTETVHLGSQTLTRALMHKVLGGHDDRDPASTSPS